MEVIIGDEKKQEKTPSPSDRDVKLMLAAKKAMKFLGFLIFAIGAIMATTMTCDIATPAGIFMMVEGIFVLLIFR